VFIIEVEILRKFSLDELKQIAKVIFSKAVTAVDPSDGPTDAGGAIADHTTVERGRSMDMDAKAYLENNDAYPFFQSLGDLLITGPTHTNVMDIRVVLIA
jgi:glycerate-2-kinase